MKRNFLTEKTIIALFLTLSLTATAAAAMKEIKINQTGFYPNSRKVAVVITSNATAKATEFQVVRASDGRAVLSGKLSEPFTWKESGETGRWADFSIVDSPGRYKLVVNGKESYTFHISSDIFTDAARASARTYYLQRCGYELTKEFAGKWARAAGHPDTAVSFHPSSGRTAGTLSSPGGWYDAGDFGNYMVNSGITVGTLLAFYENFPDYFPDKSLNIPESGNGRPDILDEVKYNLDWMKTMQDADGGVFFKLTTLKFPGYIMPHEDNGERFVIGKSTASTLNFAACMAMAARVYASFDRQYANDCLVRAVRAWEWAQKNNNIPFRNPEDVKTGEYKDVSFEDEFIWAAAELFITTKEKAYADFLKTKDIAYKSEPSWQNVHGLAPLSLAAIKNGLPASALDSVRASIVRTADNWLLQMDKHLYRVPEMKFVWGSNSAFANMGIAMIYAYKITGNNKYLFGAAEIADYLLGKNAVGLSFMTGMGTKYAANPHHRHVVASTGLLNDKDGTVQNKRRSAPAEDNVVITGFLVGGPNAGQQDKAHEVVYAFTLPAKSYEDVYKSYASNEVAINWNAPATFLFGAIDALMNETKKTAPAAAPAKSNRK
ncbi:MAG: glycoside hydrolase family 9 protein [Chitinispirillales bacterium]|nr:glycoside hydrolase family 9 protein [Chitinispirillales bacterium]